MNQRFWTIVASDGTGDWNGDFVGQTFARFANALKAAKSLANVGFTVTIVQS